MKLKIATTLPMIGLWIYLLGLNSQKKNLARNDQFQLLNIFTVHTLLLSYFISSTFFLNALVWIVPYFFESAIEVLIQINIFFIILTYTFFTFSVLSEQFITIQFPLWFKKVRILLTFY